GVVGPTYSAETKAVGPLLEQASLPFITPSATNDSLVGAGWTTFHRTIGNDSQQALAAAAYFAKLNAKKVYVVAAPDNYGKTARAAIGRSDKIQVVGGTELATNTDYGALVTTITHSGAGAVYFASYTEEGVKLL